MIQKLFTKLTRPLTGVTALVLSVAGMAPLFMGSASAAGQVANRSIQMSSSAAGATGVSYKVSFTPFTTGTQSIVINFCAESPIIGGTCTTPTSFTVASAGFTAGTGTTNWTTGTLGANTFKLTKNSGSALTTSAADFTITGVTNPNFATCGSVDTHPNCTFYARIYTYDCTDYGAHVGGGACSTTGTAYSSPTAIGSNVDYGGFALSTTSTIGITATVMETLVFCVSKLAPGPTCGQTGQAPTAPTLTLGHGSPQTLDTSVVDTDTAYTQISTNALSGAVVNMKTNNSCSGLSRDGGTTCSIAGQGAFAALSAGAGKFGLNVANGTGGTGSVTASASYGTTAGSYGMGAGVTSTYGDTIEQTGSTPGPCASVNSLLTFAATAAATTPAGVYTANETLIATGTY